MNLLDFSLEAKLLWQPAVGKHIRNVYFWPGNGKLLLGQCKRIIEKTLRPIYKFRLI